MKINIAQDPTKSLPEDLQSINNNVAKYTNIAENGRHITIYRITPSKKN